MKLTDFLEKPISNDFLKKYSNYLSIDFEKLLLDLFNGSNILEVFNDDEFFINEAWIFYSCYENLLDSLDFKFDNYYKYNNLIELVNDYYDLGLDFTYNQITCYGDVDEFDNQYIACIDHELNDEEFKIFDKWRSSCDFILNDKSSLIVDYEIAIDLIFIYKNGKIIDYYFHDNLYSDNFEISYLYHFVKCLLEKNSNLIGFAGNDIDSFKDLLKKYRKETREVIF